MPTGVLVTVLIEIDARRRQGTAVGRNRPLQNRYQPTVLYPVSLFAAGPGSFQDDGVFTDDAGSIGLRDRGFTRILLAIIGRPIMRDLVGAIGQKQIRNVRFVI